MNISIMMRSTRWVMLLGLLTAPTYGSILSATIHSSTSPADTPFPASNTIDGSGLNTSGGVGSWTHNSLNDDMYIASTVNAFIIFDLGSTQGLVTEVFFWNYSHDSTLDRSILDFTLTSSDDVSNLAASGNGFNQQSGTLVAGIGGDEPAQLFSYRVNTVRYIRLDVDTVNTADKAGLSEIRFTNNVPEPSTLVVFVIGITLIGLWRRKQATMPTLFE